MGGCQYIDKLSVQIKVSCPCIDAQTIDILMFGQGGVNLGYLLPSGISAIIPAGLGLSD